MGTQFNSRLSAATRSSIISTVKQAQQQILNKYSGSGPKLQHIEQLPDRAKRQLGDTVVGSYVAVAKGYNLITLVEQSQCLVLTLDWLMRLRSDADYNGFKHIIKMYGLESITNVPGTLKAELLKILKAKTETQKDPLRTAASNAAVSVLADVCVSHVSTTALMSSANIFGRQLSEKSLNSVISRFISAFMRELVMATLHSSDPDQADRTVQEAIGLTEKASQRFSTRVVSRIKSQGAIASPPDIQRVLAAELQEMVSKTA